MHTAIYCTRKPHGELRKTVILLVIPLLHCRLKKRTNKRHEKAARKWTMTRLSTQVSASLPIRFPFTEIHIKAHRKLGSRKILQPREKSHRPKLDTKARLRSRSGSLRRRGGGKRPERGRSGSAAGAGGVRAAAAPQPVPSPCPAAGTADALCPLRAAIGTAVRTAPRPPTGVSGRTGWARRRRGSRAPAPAPPPQQWRAGGLAAGLGWPGRRPARCGSLRGRRRRRQRERRPARSGRIPPGEDGEAGRGAAAGPSGNKGTGTAAGAPVPCVGWGAGGDPGSWCPRRGGRAAALPAASPCSMLAMARRRCSSVTSSPMTTSR